MTNDNSANPDIDVELDIERFPFEYRRAIEKAGNVLVEQLTPGLYARPEPGVVVIVSNEGEDLGEIPLYRLKPIDPELIRPYVVQAVDQFPPHVADQIVAGLNNGDAVIRDLTNSEWVTVDVGPVKVARVHRAHLVPSWPLDAA